MEGASFLTLESHRMYAVCDLPELDADIAAISSDEAAELMAAAFRGGNRGEFLRIGQRLVRDAVLSIRGSRLRPHRADMYSEGLLALITQFDKTTRPIEQPYWHFRVAVRRAIFEWARQQKIIRRKGAKHATVFIDADVSCLDDAGATYVESEAVAPACVDSTIAIYEAASDHTDRRILLILAPLTSRFTAVV